MNYLTLTFSKQKKETFKTKDFVSKTKEKVEKGHDACRPFAGGVFGRTEERESRIEDKKQPRLRSCEALTVPVLIQLDDGNT